MGRQIPVEERMLEFFKLAHPETVQSQLRTINSVLRGRKDYQEFIAKQKQQKQQAVTEKGNAAQ